MAASTHIPRASTVDPAEVERFSRIADEWWDPAGKFAPLHRLNPVRLRYIRDRAADHWRRDALGGSPLRGLSLLDIGCGGGLICEPMARLGARVTGIDAAKRNIAIAGLHAGRQELDIDYRTATAEALAGSGAQFDIVLALEIAEHVAEAEVFLEACGRLVKPGGLVFLSTLNRTAKAWALAIAGAEYLLRWLPRGTHDWRKFLKPSEVVHGLAAGGIAAQEIVGVVYSPLSRTWSLHKSDLDVNYMLYGSKSPARRSATN
ncbi:bifunctional 2-polyprenyl-6-hydroxyphenol methylase/3-demethylubiquinol 3-O-methyltransferase UbiG [Enhydrobacter sp.]|jgi:2-polyprenyl-6-hydroxyphenyl methylase/3-demethylubiquinone-9 3-methyltransferase|uniref:bifunctional 2-polyprenyl-6-hydroxyphenol methylase/3-demethylubiquinol 3-O-methyltransferase UbiG n=1 Tax=Enhydrobacter sp. TaxID=1894999 RepID=UPI0026259807|nr:bifunctional 2-polyprenyl-6-hydroxyphenol methylase/3-demethylubiquinol 3-O-methyltransferase UbiG [Enhydrobacter sp.]WIM11876.1 MAG: 2-polyprenyl-6-hydroxyphenyl methylase/3-demethylubiquinone-9 3-methyltransferase [Enhydrobacter sp.]